MLNDVFKAYKEINSTNSVKDKEAILNKYKNCSELKTLLERALNPHRHYQFNKMPEGAGWDNTSDKFADNSCYQMFLMLLDRLEDRVVTGNEAKQEVYDVFRRINMQDHAEFYQKVLLKEALGVAAKTVNKVWPKLIPEFKLMLAPNKIAELPNLKYPCYVQPKLDGYRCVYKNEAMWSRAGKPFGNKHLMDYFSSLLNVGNQVLDGELYAPGLNFNKLQTILNTEDAPIPKGLKYFVYDCIPGDDWEKQVCKLTYEERLRNLRYLLNDMVADYKKVIDISTDKAQNAVEVKDLYKKYLNSGYEGAMIKDVDGKYRWKRVTLKSGEMLKLKPFKSLDLEIKEIYEGEGNFQGKAGGIVVDYNGNAVRVGSGFDLPTREDMAKQPTNYIGRTAEVKYFEETPDGSLRFPIFVRFRPEKD